jgi:hypothetical protein
MPIEVGREMVEVAIFQARQRNGGDLFEWLFALGKGQERH